MKEYFEFEVQFKCVEEYGVKVIEMDDWDDVSLKVVGILEGKKIVWVEKIMKIYFEMCFLDWEYEFDYIIQMEENLEGKYYIIIECEGFYNELFDQKVVFLGKLNVE